MAKRKNKLMTIIFVERFLIWAIVFAIVVSTALLAQIALAKIQMDAEVDSFMNLGNVRRK